MDIRKVKKLIEMLEESEIAEIEIHEGEESVRISRHSSAPGSVQTVVQVPGPDSRNRGLQEAAGADQSDIVEAEPEGHTVRAPMVGIFYEAPSPGKPPFVELGTEVKKGDVICIIEAMKIMNQIEAEVSGVISRILVENGEPVEYGQPLYLIRES